jgi:hypothetical protein
MAQSHSDDTPINQSALTRFQVRGGNESALMLHFTQQLSVLAVAMRVLQHAI